jgi:hypothetical protein
MVEKKHHLVAVSTADQCETTHIDYTVRKLNQLIRECTQHGGQIMLVILGRPYCILQAFTSLGPTANQEVFIVIRRAETKTPCIESHISLGDCSIVELFAALTKIGPIPYGLSKCIYLQ